MKFARKTNVAMLMLWSFLLGSAGLRAQNPVADYMDKAGLGTVSTRTNILRTLLERKYIRYSGKYVVPTPKGLFLYETVRSMKVADASLTSGWETELARIERGELSQEKFLDGVLETVNEVTGEIFRNHPVKKRPQGTT